MLEVEVDCLPYMGSVLGDWGLDEIACCCVNILNCVVVCIFISCLSLVFLLRSLKGTCLSRGCTMVSEAIGYIGCQRRHRQPSQSLSNFSSQWQHYHYTPISLPAFLKLVNCWVCWQYNSTTIYCSNYVNTWWALLKIKFEIIAISHSQCCKIKVLQSC